MNKKTNSPNSSSMPRAIVFDLGGVLVEVDKSRSSQKWKNLTGGDASSFEDAFMANGLKNRFNEGGIATQHFLETVTEKMRKLRQLPIQNRSKKPSQKEISLIKEIWSAMLLPKPYAQSLTDELKPSFSLAILSDTDPLHVEFMEKNFSFFRAFSPKIYSFHIQTVKPSKRMYGAVVSSLKLSPSQCLFFDDREKNIQGALSVGMRAHRAQNETDILKGLREEGIDLPLPPPVPSIGSPDPRRT